MNKNTCIHFTGVLNDDCKIGESYRELVGGEDAGWIARIPCTGRTEQTVECSFYTLPTEEELQKEEESYKKTLDGTLLAIELIKKHCNNSVNVAGIIECPVCKNKLSYRVHSNGHIWGQCSSDGCLGWMM